MFVHVLLLAWVQLLNFAASEHVVYNGKTLEGGEGVCPDHRTTTVLQEINVELRDVFRDTILPSLVIVGSQPSRPANSCHEISELHPRQPSGHYWVRSRNGTAVQVYCDMDRVCGCNSTGGWTRIANLNMSNPSEQCPGNLTIRTYSSSRRLCGRGTIGAGCRSAVYSSYGISYSNVCGRMIGYEYASPSAFSRNSFSSPTIDSYYVDGVSLTHGPSGARQHIWTFAAGFLEDITTVNDYLGCPCADRVVRTVVPSFVGNDYFCESGNPGPSWSFYVLYANDPLWDGQGCGSPPCCELSYPPGETTTWFCKQLPQDTTDDVEVRICADQPDWDEDIPLERIELYIR